MLTRCLVQRTGLTKPVLGADDPTARAPGKGFHMKFDFRETVSFPVTLYKARRDTAASARRGAAARRQRVRARPRVVELQTCFCFPG
jgi:hypothetical protein